MTGTTLKYSSGMGLPSFKSPMTKTEEIFNPRSRNDADGNRILLILSQNIVVLHFVVERLRVDL